MGNRNILAAAVLVLSFNLITGLSFATDENQASNSGQGVQNLKKEMTKDETLAQLKKEIATSDEIFNAVQGLKSEKDSKGNIIYTLNGVTIDNLSKEDLDKLLTRVRQSLVKIRTDRIQKQLETVKRAQGPRVIFAPPQPARTPPNPTPPARVPQAPPTLPKR
jgi:hypothetical protein